eukprot:m.39228 g.39228  ORF g.39228 m.39228 type:complete len:404 (-) comp11756_c0_seq1:1124-2335(-)
MRLPEFGAGLWPRLESEGYAAVSEAFDREWSDAVREEVLQLHAAGLMPPSGNIVKATPAAAATATSTATSTAAGQVDAVVGIKVFKPNVYEVDLMLRGERNSEVKAETYMMSETLAELVDSKGRELLSALNAAAPPLKLSRLDQIKVQFNTGLGGCFPMHFDTTQEVSERHLTCVLYLNPDWSEESKGHIRLLPLPGAPVDVAPKHNLLVMFCSHRMLHWPRPSFKPRVVLSFWFATAGGQPFPVINRTALRLKYAAPTSVVAADKLALLALSPSASSNPSTSSSAAPSSTTTATSTSAAATSTSELDGVGVSSSNTISEAVLQKAMDVLSHSNLRRAAAKLVYAEMWAESVRLAFGSETQDDAVERSLVLHWREVEKIKTLFGPDLIRALHVLCAGGRSDPL